VGGPSYAQLVSLAAHTPGAALSLILKEGCVKHVSYAALTGKIFLVFLRDTTSPYLMLLKSSWSF
jgi:hypothetical protein